MNELKRLNKFISKTGGARREADKYSEQGYVTVRGTIPVMKVKSNAA